MKRSLLALLPATLLTISLPVSSEDWSAVQPALLSLPSGPGSIEGLGESFIPDLNTGTSNQNFSFELPAGRNGFVPTLMLNYSNGLGNGIAGVGRKLAVPYIQRQTDKGLPIYQDWPIGDNVDNDKDGEVDEYDEFDTYITSKGEELVPTGDGKYRARFADGFVVYERYAEGWKATSPDGNEHYFGLDTDSQITFLQDNVYRWHLTRSEDTNSNEIDYQYESLDDTEQRYLTKITYNHHQGNEMSVSLGYENRPDQLTDYRSGFALQTHQRLNVVNTEVAGNSIRKYQLDYEDVKDWQAQSLLSGISQQDGLGTNTLLAMQFTYTSSEASPKAEFVPSMKDIQLTNPDTDFIDLNGDGLPDMIDVYHKEHLYWLNEGLDDNGELQWGERQQMSSSIYSRLSSPNIKWADINGDGQSNLVIYNPDNTVFYDIDPDLNWNMSGSLSKSKLRIDSPDVRLIDMNNDKRIDAFQILVDSRGKVLSHSVMLNLPNGWSDPIDLPIPSKYIKFSNPRYSLADMNGDRLQDIVYASNAKLYYFPNRGLKGFGKAIHFKEEPSGLDDQTGIRIADFNNDGRSDLMYIDGKVATVWPNLGERDGLHKLGQPISVTSPHNRAPSEVRILDINGNGSKDIVWHLEDYDDASYAYIDFYPDEGPTQLKTISNGIGKKTTLHYSSLANEMIRDEKIGQPWDYFVPFGMQVVKQIETVDGSSPVVQKITIDYHNGFYHREDKTFRGFEQTEQTDIGDASVSDLTTIYTFNLGLENEVLNGKPMQVETRNQSGKSFWKDDYQWQARTLYEGVNGDERNVTFAALIGKTRYLIEQGNGNSITLGWEYDYDQNGNLITLDEKGRMDGKWNSARKTHWTYSGDFSSNTETNTVNYPVEKWIENANGQTVSREQWMYDDESFSPALNGQVTSGNLTAQLVWHTPEDSAGYIFSKRQKFDSYGNVIASFDPLWGTKPGHASYYSYDDDFSMFITNETIGTGTTQLTATAQYDTGLGVMTHSVDFNGNQSEFRYDNFARLKAIIKPGDTVESPTVSYDYQLGHLSNGKVLNWVETSQRQASGGQTVDSRAYFDGMGRNIMSRTESENGVVVNRKEYNQRGGVAKESLPYFSTGLAYVEDNTYPSKDYIYDALGRVIRAYQPTPLIGNDRLYSQVQYGPLTRWLQDEAQTQSSSSHGGAGKYLIYDGLNNKDSENGRLRQVIDNVGVDEFGNPSIINGWTTDYNFNALDQFTQIVDGKGNSRTMSYDALGRELYIDDPNRGRSWYSYDDGGNLSATRDARGIERHYSYDGLNRVTKELQKNSLIKDDASETWLPLTTGLVDAVSYRYDTLAHTGQANLKGMLSEVRDEAGYNYYSYDARGRVISQSRQIQGDGINTPVYTSKRVYDSADNLVNYTYPDGTQLQYGYSAGGQLESVSGVISNIDYTAHGAIAKRVLTNGTVTESTFDSRLRLLSLESTNNNNVLQSLSYTFDAASNITRINDDRSVTDLTRLADKLGTTSNKLQQTADYQYDDFYRLVSAEKEQSSISYHYDPIGNMVARTESNPILGNKELLMRYGNSADANNDQTWSQQGRDLDNKAGPNALTYDGQSLSYDGVGNRTKDSKFDYQWDANNRLAGLSSADFTANYGYDAQQQRRYKVVKDKEGNREETIYIDEYSELRGGKLIKSVSIAGQRIAVSSQNGGDFKAEQFYLNQHIGSTELTLDSSGEVINAFNYNPYGSISDAFGDTEQSLYRYTGKEHDAESGLGYFSHRYLDFTNGGFISPDPVFAKDARFIDPQRWSPYSYGRNNPLSYTDPTGLSVWGVSAGFTVPIPFTGMVFGGSLTLAMDSEGSASVIITPELGVAVKGGTGAFLRGLWGGGDNSVKSLTGAGASVSTNVGIFSSSLTLPYKYTPLSGNDEYPYGSHGSYLPVLEIGIGTPSVDLAVTGSYGKNVKINDIELTTDIFGRAGKWIGSNAYDMFK